MENNNQMMVWHGPPFASGTPHHGHIMGATIKDVFIRYMKSKGIVINHNVLTFDTHGVPIEDIVIKLLKLSSLKDLDIDAFFKECRKQVLGSQDAFIECFKSMKIGVVDTPSITTMDLPYMNCMFTIFAKLYEKGLIYEDNKVVPYSPKCGVLSNFEAEQAIQIIETIAVYFSLKLEGGFSIMVNGNTYEYSNCHIVVYTTTPWTIPANAALCINAELTYVLVEYNSNMYIIGEECIKNAFQKELEIIHKFSGSNLVGCEYQSIYPNSNCGGPVLKIFSDSFVLMSGTAVVHIAGAYGENDYKLSKEHKIPIYDFLDDWCNASLTDYNGDIAGLNIKVLLDLKNMAAHSLKIKIKHEVSHCPRNTSVCLINRLVKAWFIRVEIFRECLVELTNTIHWNTSAVKNRFINWVANARDWCISRDRFWGTPIPLWRSEDGDIKIISSKAELESICGYTITDLHLDHLPKILIIDGIEYFHIKKIFDCWFESGALPFVLAMLDGKTIEELTVEDIAADLISEGIDQTRGWFYTLLIISTLLCDCVPFKNVIVNGIILGSDGKKMSKSDKNYSDPLDIINKYGPDTLRLYLLGSIAFDGKPAKLIEYDIETLYKKTILQLQSSLKLYLEYMEFLENTKELSDIDELVCEANIWAVAKYNKIYDEYYALMESFQYRIATSKLLEAINLLNRRFNVILRPYYKDPSNSLCRETLMVMQYILMRIMRDFEPFLPSISVKILNKMEKYNYPFSKSLSLINTCDQNFQVVSDIIHRINELRGNYNISGRIPLSKISISRDIFDKIRQYHASTFFITNACFILEIEPIDSEAFPKCETSFIGDEFFKKYKNQELSDNTDQPSKEHIKNLNIIKSKILKMSGRELNTIIDTEFEGFFLSKDLFRIKWHQREGKEEIIDHFLNSFIILNTEKTEKVIQHTKYRHIVRKIQMTRKDVDLRPLHSVTIKWRTIGNAMLDIKEIESLLGYNVTFVYDENFRDGTTIALGGVSVAVTQKFKVFDLNSIYVSLVF